jgi:FkbM family methyltransferase
MLKIPAVFFQILFLSWKNGRNLSEKISVFNTLWSLKFNKSFRGKIKNTECAQNILNYSITGYDYDTLHTLFYDIFLLKPYSFKTSNIRPLIIDCGAHIGMSVLYFKKLFSDSKIIAIEANPYAYKLLEKNIKNNDLTGITTYNAILSDKKGKMSFYINDNMGTFNGSVRKDIGGTTELIVKSMPLSELISGISEKIDLVKIDVEGSESVIISDLSNSSLLGIPEQYIIEYHHKSNNDKAALADFLKKFEDAGYEYNLWSRSQIGTCQDILIHCYR